MFLKTFLIVKTTEEPEVVLVIIHLLMKMYWSEAIHIESMAISEEGLKRVQ